MRSLRVSSRLAARARSRRSAAVAWTLGYKDGEGLPLVEHVQVVARIARVVRLPITVDLERGYSDEPDAVAFGRQAHVVSAGACGVNLEDRGADRAPRPPRFAPSRRQLGDRVFVNARACNPEADLAARAAICGSSRRRRPGFAFRLTDASTIRTLVRSTPLPVNVLQGPVVAGVRRYSAGPSPALAAYSTLRAGLTYSAVNELF